MTTEGRRELARELREQATPDLERFDAAVTAIVERWSHWMLAEHHDEFTGFMTHVLHGSLPGLSPDTPDSGELSLPRGPELLEASFKIVAQPFAELLGVQVALNDPLRYLRHPPPEGISEAEHLRYHQEHWLHAMSVVKRRMSTFVRSLANAYPENASQIRSLAQATESEFDALFGPVIHARDRLVHQQDATPPAVLRARFREIVASDWGLASPDDLAGRTTKDVIDDLCNTIDVGTAATRLILDEMCRQLYPLIFDGDEPKAPKRRSDGQVRSIRMAGPRRRGTER